MTCKIQWQHININKLEWESALVSSDVFACDPCFQLSTRFYFHLVKPKAWHQMLIPWTRTELNPDSQQPQMFKAMLRVPLILAHVRLLRIGLEVKSSFEDFLFRNVSALCFISGNFYVLDVLDFHLLGVWLLYVGFSVSQFFISLTVFILFIFKLIVQMYLTTFLLKFLWSSFFLKTQPFLVYPFSTASSFIKGMFYISKGTHLCPFEVFLCLSVSCWFCCLVETATHASLSNLFWEVPPKDPCFFFKSETCYNADGLRLVWVTTAVMNLWVQPSRTQRLTAPSHPPALPFYPSSFHSTTSSKP